MSARPAAALLICLVAAVMRSKQVFFQLVIAALVCGVSLSALGQARAPIVSNEQGYPTEAGGAVLNAVVNPNGADTSVFVQYGPGATYGYLTSPYNVTGSTKVSFTFKGLAPNTIYHWRSTASNSVRTVYGKDRLFATVALGANDGGMSLDQTLAWLQTRYPLSGVTTAAGQDSQTTYDLSFDNSSLIVYRSKYVEYTFNRDTFNRDINRTIETKWTAPLGDFDSVGTMRDTQAPDSYETRSSVVLNAKSRVVKTSTTSSFTAFSDEANFGLVLKFLDEAGAAQFANVLGHAVALIKGQAVPVYLWQPPSEGVSPGPANAGVGGGQAPSETPRPPEGGQGNPPTVTHISDALGGPLHEAVANLDSAMDFFPSEMEHLRKLLDNADFSQNSEITAKAVELQKRIRAFSVALGNARKDTNWTTSSDRDEVGKVFNAVRDVSNRWKNQRGMNLLLDAGHTFPGISETATIDDWR